MRLIVQRVKSAKVITENNVLGKIGSGYFVLVGIKKGDIPENARILANKLLKLRVMSDEEGKMNLSIKEVGASLLIVSQFTLYADTSAGNRPSFLNAGDPKEAEKIYNYFVDYLKSQGINVETGKFGAYMKIDVSLDGPVTIILEK